MVLLFFFLFCSGGFLVAHGDSFLSSTCTVTLASGSRFGSSSIGYGLYSTTAAPSVTSGRVTSVSLSGRSQTLVSGREYVLSLKCGYYIDSDTSGYEVMYFTPSSLNLLGIGTISSSSVGTSVGGVLVLSWDWDTSLKTLIVTLKPTQNLSFSAYTVYPVYQRTVTFENCKMGNSYLISDVVFSVDCVASPDEIVDAILKQTEDMNSNHQETMDKIESQYDTSQGSEVGSAAQDFADQASESLGVVSYVDTLFSGLSGLVTAGSTTLTFPAFAIAVQGTDYQVWQEHTFDLSQLDGWFSGLMAAVRLATSVVVVGAVIHYLQSVYKDVIG